MVAIATGQAGIGGAEFVTALMVAGLLQIAAALMLRIMTEARLLHWLKRHCTSDGRLLGARLRAIETH